MSTFDGIVPEFPEIRIDRFLQSPSAPPPAAAFLSHVHTDHLIGLETFKAAFIYCSPATREILLKLEKYPDRMNFANGILEQRIRRFDKKMELKAIPLETPTIIETSPGRSIRVTLFDANHCVGAVMFLIEGDGKAILYTGDIRSESWWVNNLLRNPLLLPYVASKDQPPLKRLDNMYLDTTFANKAAMYHQFPSKASGVMELLRKASQYPKDTMFYLHAWTFGYEEVMQSLATFLETQIHVDEYKHGVYKSLRRSDEAKAPEAFKLVGTHVGNTYQEGCLTKHSTDRCRIHSCEKGTGCDIWHKRFVRITPIVSKLPNGQEMMEVGAGGGQNDLTQQVGLDISDNAVYGQLMKLCFSELKQQPTLRDKVSQMIASATEEPNDGIIMLDLADLVAGATGQDIGGIQDRTSASGKISLATVVHALAKRAAQNAASTAETSGLMCPKDLPQHITFPYSRHSSYSELCLLVEAFMPQDIHPCTVDEQNWDLSHSMGHLFGHIYHNPTVFRHDQEMMQKKAAVDDEGRSNAGAASQTPPRDTQEFEERLYSRFGGQPSSVPSTPARRPRRRSLLSESRNDDEASPKRRRVVDEGSFWPPVTIDHYSPPARSPRSLRPSMESSRRSSQTKEIDHYSPHRRLTRSADPQINAQPRKEVNNASAADHVWSQPSYIDDKVGSPSRQINRWQKRIAESRRQSTPFEDSSGNNAHFQAENYGRLSPPPLSPLRRRSSQQSGRRSSGRDQSEEYGRLTPPAIETPPDKVAYDELEVKRGLQMEAYNAALGNDGLDWSSIELVSVHGHHHIKEEEL